MKSILTNIEFFKMADLFEKCSPVEGYVPIRRSSLTDSLELRPLEEFIALPDNLIFDLSSEEKIFDDIMVELLELQKRQLNCEKELDRLMVKIEQFPQLYFFTWVFIILYPSILMRYLRSRKYIAAREYSSAIARCIQHHKTAEGMKKDWYKYSLQYLFNYKDKVLGTIELKILPGMYPIDSILYREAQDEGIRDLHYEGITSAYIYRDPDILDEERIYVGHRDCFHALAFGDKLLIEKYIQNALIYNNCLGDAIKDFVGLPKNIKIEKAIELYRSGKKI